METTTLSPEVPKFVAEVLYDHFREAARTGNPAELTRLRLLVLDFSYRFEKLVPRFVPGRFYHDIYERRAV
jgi:hypothetical protein